MMGSSDNGGGSGRRRLSSMFGSKRDRVQPDSQSQLAPDNGSMQQHRFSNGDTADSAYASSAQTAPSQSHLDLTPFENTGQIQGVNSDRHLAVNKANGDVVDQNSGQVVTTTTTTTTTTITKPNGEQQVQVSSAPAPAQPGPPTANTESVVNEMPAEPVRRPHHQPDNSTSTSGMLDSPIVPSRSPYRTSREVLPSEHPVTPPDSSTYPDRMGSPSSVNATNFSRPGKSGESSGAPLTGLASLKAAAKGLHGVGETLRGTLNSGIDQRFPGGDAETAAATHAKNQAVLETGRRHMEGVMQTPVTSSATSPPQHGLGSAPSTEQPPPAPYAPQPGQSSPAMTASSYTPVPDSDPPTAPSSMVAARPIVEPPKRTSSRFSSFRRPKQNYVPPRGSAIPEQSTHAAMIEPASAGTGSRRFSKFLKRVSSQNP